MGILAGVTYMFFTTENDLNISKSEDAILKIQSFRYNSLKNDLNISKGEDAILKIQSLKKEIFNF